jgi:histidinol-phosphate/aromatic aminotransferase/cobyric acid decarboxylase-like protein
MRKYCPVWNINGIAEAFLEYFPRHRRAYAQSCELVARDSRALYHQLCELPYLDPYPPSANFVFAKVDERFMTAAELREDLFVNHNLLIKDCSNKTGLEHGNYVRISARKPADNSKLVEALLNRMSSAGVS